MESSSWFLSWEAPGRVAVIIAMAASEAVGRASEKSSSLRSFMMSIASSLAARSRILRLPTPGGQAIMEEATEGVESKFHRKVLVQEFPEKLLSQAALT